MHIACFLSLAVALLSAACSRYNRPVHDRPVHEQPPAESSAVHSTVDADDSTTLRPTPDAPTVAIAGSVHGYDTQDYRIIAPAGTPVAVNLRTSGRFLAFVVRDGDSSISTEATAWQGAIPAGGHCTVRVFLMRAEARRNGTASYVVEAALQ